MLPETNTCFNEVHRFERSSAQRRHSDFPGDTGQMEDDEYHYHGTFINAGHYKVLLSAENMDGLAFDALDIQ